MGFKLKSIPYINNSTPIYRVNMEEGVLGKANNNGTIILKQGLTPSEEEKIITHEQVHIDQMRRGDLDYDEKNVYWKNKTYPRSKMNEGSKKLPWEKEAYLKK
tara:strand:+ start:7399 stop:7707 length:309 start_codon:yes stop_codon:yes gene_type:complete